MLLLYAYCCILMLAYCYRHMLPLPRAACAYSMLSTRWQLSVGGGRGGGRWEEGTTAAER